LFESLLRDGLVCDCLIEVNLVDALGEEPCEVPATKAFGELDYELAPFLQSEMNVAFCLAIVLLGSMIVLGIPGSLKAKNLGLAEGLHSGPALEVIEGRKTVDLGLLQVLP
jgi:hypothetical protein